MKLVCLTLLLAVASATHNDITIYTFPSPAYFPPGQILRIGCDHPRSYEFLHWVHPVDGIVSVSQGRFVVSEYTETVSLRVSNTRESDEGEYKCVFRNGAAEVMSDPVMSHFRLPLIPTTKNSTMTLAVGDSMNMSCDGLNVELRQWVRYSSNNLENPVLNASDGSIVISADSEWLKFVQVKLEHAGDYRCLLRNDLGLKRIFVTVHVVVRPVTSVTPEVLTVEDGAEATISCHVTGLPLPSIVWRDSENRIISGSTQGITKHSASVNNTNLLSTLTFASVDSTFTGPYTCRAVNEHGDDSSTSFLRLAGTPDPPTNVMLSVVNNTNIQVTWDAPNSDVTTYVVTWDALNSTSRAGRDSAHVDPLLSAGTSHVITGLERLTAYSVFVHATNSDGTGMNSPPELITTFATVPGPANEVIILDVGPTSVRVEWSTITLPQDDGGAPLRTVRLTYMEAGQEVWSEDEVVVDVGRGYAVVSGLDPQRRYVVRMQVGNGQGYSAGLVSESFETTPPGFPGSPSHLSVTNHSVDSVVLCWRESAIGRPFTTYNVEITESLNTLRSKVLKLNISSVRHVEGCEAGAKITDLDPGTCYTFVVYVTNIQGVGQPSPTSEVACSLSCGRGAVCEPSVAFSSDNVIGVAVAATVFALLIVASVLFVCLVVRRRKKMALRVNMHNKNYYPSDKTGTYDSRRDSEQSNRSGSTVGLLPSPRAYGYSASSSPPTSSSEGSHESPDTATTNVSNGDPFDFNAPNIRPPMPLPPPHIVCHPGLSKVEYPQPGRSVSDEYPIYPILEDPPPYPHQHPAYPVKAQASRKGHVNRSAPHLTVNIPPAEGDMIMTDNPNYEEKSAVMSVPYYVDHNNSSEAGSELPSTLHAQIPTPHFGESYSQSGYSPVMQRRQAKHSPPSSKRSQPREGESNSKLATEEDDGTEFIDNDAYITFSAPGPAKFSIVGGERGGVFETVQAKRGVKS